MLAGGLVACALVFAQSIPPDDVQIVGDIDYGQTSPPVDYTPSPPYRALVFTGNGGDQILVSVTAATGKAAISIADGSLRQLATGTGELRFQLPNHGPDAEAFYILFREADRRPARFTVRLRKVG